MLSENFASKKPDEVKKIIGDKLIEILDLEELAPEFDEKQEHDFQFFFVGIYYLSFSSLVIFKNGAEANKDILARSKFKSVGDVPGFKDKELDLSRCYLLGGDFAKLADAALNLLGEIEESIQNFSVKSLIAKTTSSKAQKKLLNAEKADVRKRLNIKDKPLHTPELELTDEQKGFLFSGDFHNVAYARRMEYVFGKQLRYIRAADKWATYSKGIWTIESNARNSAIYPYTNQLAEALIECASNKKERQIAETFASTKKINMSIAQLKGLSSLFITYQDLNTHKNLLNCKNGVIDLQTKKLLPHAPEFLFTQMINAEYRAGYHNEIVDNFLKDIMPDDQTRAALLRFLGYGLTGEISEEKALFIHGGGGNGKGTLTKTLLRLLGTYATAFPIEGVLSRYQTRDANAATPAFNQLEFKRLAIAEEIPAGEKLNLAKFKLLTGGDPLPIRRLHEEFSVIEDPTHKMIFSGNHLPELDDTRDFGLNRRLSVIKFTQTFDAVNADIHLKDILSTPDALSGLLTLLVDNAAQWYQDGLINSAAMDLAKNEYLREQDFILEFIDEYCVVVANATIRLKEFTEKLRAESSVARTMTDRELNNALTKALSSLENVSKKKAHGVSKIFGLGWQSDESIDDQLGIPISPEDIPY